MNRTSTQVALLVAATVALAGCNGQTVVVTGPTPSALVPSTPTSSPTPTLPLPGQASPTVTPSATPTAAPTPSPAATRPPAAAPKPPVRDAVLRPGAKGTEVLSAQRRLVTLGYWLGSPDGVYGDLTRQAVMALQKAAGLSRDGMLGPRTRAALDAGTRPKARSTKGHVLEVDKRRQLVLIVDQGRVTRVLNASSGSGEYYTYEDRRYLAVTPSGSYRVFRQIDGLRVSHLGELHRPKYFNGGIALHGSGSVPAYGASHGCVRVSNPAMDWIWGSGQVPLRTSVLVY